MLPPINSARLRYLDWTRGLAALIMLQGHVFHSFTRTDLRGAGPYIFSQFLGGLGPGARVVSALRRARYLLVIAFLFRIQLWLFSLPWGTWSSILKVDVLNCMALAGAAFSAMAVFRTVERARLCAVLGLATAAASPLISMLNWS